MKKVFSIIIAVLLCSALMFTSSCSMFKGANSSGPSTTAPSGNTSRNNGTTYIFNESVSTTADSSVKVISNGVKSEVFFSEPMAKESMIPDDYNTEEYDSDPENRMMKTAMSPLSTFSIDVDTASYSNVRRYLNYGQLPPADAVRTEELINYFSYDLPNPTGDMPFSVTTEIAQCPWNSENNLVMIALQGKRVEQKDLPLSNLVFLLDVSGSMNSPDKLPLLKESFQLLTEQLGENDKVSIVVYAGSSGVVLEGARGDEKEKILEALDRLEAGGSTAGSEGIEKAYAIAKKYFIPGGNNRVILATDGDFNVGVSSEGELKRLIENKRKEGISLSVLGFGTGNIKDNKMETLADNGNGNYAYIDSVLEAKKVLVNELGGTLLTIAKDVKIQVEFNPMKVKEYRLVGYENRVMRNEDFDDDTKDAGEIGAGHNVIAFYEIVPYKNGETAESSGLKYQSTDIRQEWENEWMEVRLRYKDPDGDVSKKIVHAITQEQYLDKPTETFRFASAVAEFGLIMSESEYKGTASLESVKTKARNAMGEDSEGYRSSFLELVDMAIKLK